MLWHFLKIFQFIDKYAFSLKKSLERNDCASSPFYEEVSII